MWKRYLMVLIAVVATMLATNQAAAAGTTCNPFPSSASAYTVLLRSEFIHIIFTPRSLSATSCDNYQDFSNIGYGTAWAALGGDAIFHGTCGQKIPGGSARCIIQVSQGTLDSEPSTLTVSQTQLVVECVEPWGAWDPCTVTDTLTIESPSIDISSLFAEDDPSSIVDTDGDTIPDETDTDDDNDGLVDGVDPCPLVAGICDDEVVVESPPFADPGVADPDSDSDGISDSVDSCPDTVNTDVDADGDGIDAACDDSDVPSDSLLRIRNFELNDPSACTENCDDVTLNADGGGSCSFTFTSGGSFLNTLFAALGLVPLLLQRRKRR